MTLRQTIQSHLQHLTHHPYLELVPRGNAAIEIALSIVPKNSLILIPAEGGWLSYQSLPKKLGLLVEEVKCQEAVLDLDDLKARLGAKHYSALLYQNPGGYFAEQPMKEIYELCQKNKCLVIMDVSGSIGTPLSDGRYADILVGSFGKWKLVEAKVGGFISGKEKELGERIQEKIISGQTILEERELAKVLTALEQLPARIEHLQSLCRKVIRDVEKEKLEIVRRNDRGFVVIVRYSAEEEKQRIIHYCQQQAFEWTECPRYIRINQPAISIEIKRL